MPLCFDLDGTLGRFGGGFVLLRAALGDLWGEEPTQADLARCPGSTDWEIVDDLHRQRFGTPLAPADYAAYDRACLARFEAVYADGTRHEVFQGMVDGMGRLVDAGHPVWLVSGNTPSVLAFKAGVLGVDPRIPRLGSLPHLDRAGLIRRALREGPRPHLYVGDRPHDRLAAEQTGIPFLGVGDRVPGDHPVLDPGAAAEGLVQAVSALLSSASGGIS